MFPYYLEEAFHHPYISFFHLLVNGFSVTCLIGGHIGGRGGIKMASASTPSANESAKDLILVYTVKLIIKAQISGKMVTSGISDVAISSVHSERTHLKKMINIIISNRKTIY